MNPRTPVALKENPHSCIGTVRWAENGRVYVEDMSRVFFSDEVVEYRPASIQEIIAAWQLRTFGERNEKSVPRTIQKLHEEINEFAYACGTENEAEMKREMADIAIVLYSLACRLGFSLDDAVKEKFAEVESRVDQVERDRVRGIE